jgi:hypothetical protein
LGQLSNAISKGCPEAVANQLLRPVESELDSSKNREWHRGSWGDEPWGRLGKNSLISGIDRNRCQNRKVSIVSIVLSILSQYLPYF